MIFCIALVHHSLKDINWSRARTYVEEEIIVRRK